MARSGSHELTIEIDVSSMMCTMCTGSVVEAINPSDNPHKDFSIKHVDVSLAYKSAVVTIQQNNLTITEEDIKNAIREKIIETGQEASLGAVEKTDSAIRWNWIKGMTGGSLGLAMMILNSLGLGIPYVAMLSMAGLSSLLTLIIGRQSYGAALKSLITGRGIEKLSVDTLVSLSSLTEIGLFGASLLFPGLPMGMCDAALATVSARCIGNAAALTAERAMNRGLSIIKLKDNIYDVSANDGIVKRKADELNVTDVVIVPPQMMIPANGICLDTVIINEECDTGSKSSRRIKAGNVVSAGMINVGNEPFKIIVTKKYSETDYGKREAARIIASTTKRAPLELTLNRMTSRYTLATLGVALVAGVVGSIFLTPAVGIPLALSIVTNGCPCALAFIAPWAVKIGMDKADKKGIEVKSGDALQAAGDIDTVVFDLNGTLTQGIFAVISSKRVDESVAEEDLWGMVAALEEKATNKLGKGLYQHAKKQQITPLTATELAPDLGNEGVSAMINGEKCLLGNANFMKANNIDISMFEQAGSAERVSFLAKNGQLISTFGLREPLRDDALHTVQALQAKGIQVHILTGDTEANVRGYGEAFCKNVIIHADCRPADKVACINALRATGCKVAMIGDGENDEAALRASHVGFAMRSNRNAESAAGIVIKNGRLSSILTACEIGKQTVRNIKQGLTMAFGFSALSVVGIGVLVLGLHFVNPALGMLSMLVLAGIVYTNSLRLKHQSVPDDEMKLLSRSSTALVAPALGLTSSAQPGLAPSPNPMSDRARLRSSHHYEVIRNRCRSSIKGDSARPVCR